MTEGTHTSLILSNIEGMRDVRPLGMILGAVAARLIKLAGSEQTADLFRGVVSGIERGEYDS